MTKKITWKTEAQEDKKDAKEDKTWKTDTRRQTRKKITVNRHKKTNTEEKNAKTKAQEDKIRRGRRKLHGKLREKKTIKKPKTPKQQYKTQMKTRT